MSLARLRERVPSARFVAVATLPAHTLRFHKVSKDGSGKCDAHETGNPADSVVGVVYSIDDGEKDQLHRKEGLGAGYDLKEVEVFSEQGKLAAWMYSATRVDARLKPFGWYKEHVLIGARENELPSEYISKIERVETIEDPDIARDERERAIYLPR